MVGEVVAAGAGQRPTPGVLVDGAPYEGATGHDHFG